MHNKFLVIDGEAVWMGSTDLTPNAVYGQDNNANLWRSPELARIYTAELDEMLEGGRFGASSPENGPWSAWNVQEALLAGEAGGSALRGEQVTRGAAEAAGERIAAAAGPGGPVDPRDVWLWVEVGR